MYSLFRPMPILQPFIECYWIVNGFLPTEQPLQELIFVDGKADLIFNYGDAYRRDSCSLAKRKLVDCANLDAQRDHPVMIQQSGDIQLIGVRFLPGGLAPFVNIPLFEASNQVLPIRDLLGTAILQLEGRLYDTFGDAKRQLDLLNQFFVQRLQRQEKLTQAREVAQYIRAHTSDLDMKALSDYMGYSTRSLNRFFRQYYGYSIKFYARIMRFLTAQRALLTPHSLADVAQQIGYYDQTHFNHEFTAFTGQSPSHYRSLLMKSRTAPPPNLVQFLQDDSPATTYTEEDEQIQEG